MRIPFALFGLALIVRAVVFGLHPDAAYPDAYYYADVARALHAGSGFNIDFIWSFVDVGGRIPANPILPIASNAHWMPLAAVIQLPTMWLLGPTALAAAIPFIVFGSLSAPLTWLLAREIGCSPRVALLAGVTVAIPAAVTVYMSQPDNIALYQPLGTAALWLIARGLRGHPRSFALAGLLVGIATLSRNDGVFLGLVAALAFFWDRWRVWRASRAATPTASTAARTPAIPWRYAVACFGLFLVVVAPWYLRQLIVFGSFSPSTTSGRILLIRSYQDMDSVVTPTTISSFLSQGLGPLLTSRFLGLVSALQIYFVIACPIILAPFVLIGGWARRRSIDFGPFFTYAAILFAASALLFAVHVPYGTFLHSAVALVPFTFILGLEGAIIASKWMIRYRPKWTEDGAAQIFLLAAVAAVVVNAVAFTAMAIPGWNQQQADRLDAETQMERMGIPKTDLLMSADPGGWEYLTGRGGVMTVTDPLDVDLQVAADYHIRWLVLERAYIVDPLIPIIEKQSRPAWIGPPVVVVAYTGKPTGDLLVDAAPAIAIYPVCTSPSDNRCPPAGP